LTKRLDKFTRNGLKRIKKAKLSINCLHFQYNPPIFNEIFWPDLSVQHSPHVNFLLSYLDGGNLWESTYVKLLQYWNRIGYGKRNKKDISQKMKRFINLFNDIRKKKRIHSFVHVLNSPIWQTRYNTSYPFEKKGYEIWHGHHRSACYYVLGINKVACIVLKDIKPGTLKCNSIDQRFAKLK